MTAQAIAERKTMKKIPVGIWDVPLQHEPMYWQFARGVGLSFMRRGINPEKGGERAWVFPPFAGIWSLRIFHEGTYKNLSPRSGRHRLACLPR